jgi:hypothetical protein
MGGTEIPTSGTCDVVSHYRDNIVFHQLNSKLQLSYAMEIYENLETTEVVVVGCGPTGALLTALLGNFGIENVVLEKQPHITEDPRGITLDKDGIRYLQSLGLYDKVYTEIGSRKYPTCIRLVIMV